LYEKNFENDVVEKITECEALDEECEDQSEGSE